MTALTSISVRRAPTRSWSDNVAIVDELYRFFRDQGLPTIRSSRIGIYRKTFEEFQAIAESGRTMSQQQAEDVLGTMVEFEQLRTIMRAVQASPRRGTWARELRRLCSGVAFMRDESGNSSARDFQFECFIAAVAELSGYLIRFAEPDVEITDPHRTFVVAAKRLRSLQSVEKHCRKAARQISGCDLPGLVALEMSTALFSGDACINADSAAASVTLLENAVETFIDDYAARLLRFIGNRAVGLLAVAQLPALVYAQPEGPNIMTATCWRVLCLDPEVSRSRWLAEFAAKCETGLFGPWSPQEENYIRRSN